MENYQEIHPKIRRSSPGSCEIGDFVTDKELPANLTRQGKTLIGIPYLDGSPDNVIEEGKEIDVGRVMELLFERRRNVDGDMWVRVR
jgi:hypothetical protein